MKGFKTKRIINFLVKNKNIIYYVILVIFATIGLFYAYRGYIFYQGMEKVSSGKDLLGIFFTPFVIAIIRFIIVCALGMFVATLAIAIPLRRIKVMQFEMEVAESINEIAEVQHKHVNQLYFLRSTLNDSDFFIGKYLKSGGNSYKNIAIELLTNYSSFFNDELKTNLHFDTVKEDELSKISDRSVKRLIETVRDYNDKNFIIRNRTIFGNHMMIIKAEDRDSDVYFIFSSSEYEFGEYDAYIIESLLIVAKNIYWNVVFMESVE